MARRIEHHSSWPVAAEAVYRVLVDRDHVRARLDELGGKNPQLVDLTADAGGARLHIRHGVDREFLPGVVRTVVREDLVLDRHETWTRRSDGHYTGTVEVAVAGLPGGLSGDQRLDDDDGSGSESVVDGEASVPLPVVGGRIEGAVVDQVRQLLDAEAAFTRRWLRV